MLNSPKVEPIPLAFSKSKLPMVIRFLKEVTITSGIEEILPTITSLCSWIKGQSYFEYPSDEMIISFVKLCLKTSGFLITLTEYNQTLEIMEVAQQALDQLSEENEETEKLKLSIYNNIGVYCLNSNDYTMSTQFFINCIKNSSERDPILTGILYNNLASIYLMSSQYELSYKFSKKSLFLLEPEVFSIIRSKKKAEIINDAVFKKKLIALLIGYLNISTSLEECQAKIKFSDVSMEDKDLSPASFYTNSYKLSKRYLGDTHPMTIRFYKLYSKTSDELFKKIYSTDENPPYSRVKTNPDTNRNLKSSERLISPKYIQSYRSQPVTRDAIKSAQSKTFRIHKSKLDYTSETSVTSSVRESASFIEKNEAHPGFTFDENQPLSLSQQLKKFKEAELQTSMSDANKYVVLGVQPIEADYHKPKADLENMEEDISFEIALQKENNPEKLLEKLMLPESQKKLPPVTPEPSKDPDNEEVEIEEVHEESDTFDRIEQSHEDPTISGNSKVEESLLSENYIEIAEKAQTIITSLLNQQVKLQEMVKKTLDAFSDEKNLETADVTFATEDERKLKELEEKAEQLKLENEKILKEKAEKEQELEKLRDLVGPDLPASSLVLTSYPEIDNRVEWDDHGTPISPYKLEESPIYRKPVNSKPLGKYALKSSRKFRLNFNKLKNGKIDRADDLPITRTNLPDNDVKSVSDLKFPEIGSMDLDNSTTSIMNPSHHIKDSTPKIFNIAKEQAFRRKPTMSNNGSTPKAETPSSNPTARVDTLSSAASKPGTPSGMYVPLIIPNDTPKRNNDTEFNSSKPSSMKSDFDSVNKIPSYPMILPVPTPLETLETTNNTQNNAPNRFIGPKHAIIKKRVFLLDDQNSYLLVIRVFWTAEKKSFRLELTIPGDPEQKTKSLLISHEILQYKELQTIIKMIEHKDVLPVDFQVKHLRNFLAFVKLLLLPFIGIATSPEQPHKIEVWDKPSGLILSKSLKIIFMQREFAFDLHHIKGNCFRIVLNGEKQNDVIRFDIEFDNQTIKTFLQKYGGTEAELRSVFTSLKLIAANQPGASREAVIEAKKLKAKIRDPERIDEEEVTSYSIKNPQFTILLLNVIKEAEMCLNNQKIQLATLIEDRIPTYYKLNVYEEFKKSKMTIISENAENNGFKVFVQNLYYTYGPKGKIKATGHFDYTLDMLWQDFGIVYNELKNMDNISVFSLITKLFKLTVFDKEIPQDEMEQYSENSITKTKIETYCYSRAFFGDKYKFPFTLAYVGVDGEPLGIRATIYNLQTISETGAFFFINPENWKRKPEDIKPKKSGKIQGIPALENYHLEEILQKGGWQVLRESLWMDNNPSKIAIVGIKIIKGVSSIEQLENVLNPESLLTLFLDESDENEV